MRKMSLRPVAAVAQVDGHHREVRDGGEEHPRAQQPSVVGVGQQEDQAEAGPGDRGHVVDPQRRLTPQDPLVLATPFAQLRGELRQDQQATVGPAATLDDQRPEVRRGGAVAEALGVVHQRPAVGADVDRRLGVLDDGAVLDVGLDRESADRLDLADVVQRALADHGVGADPEGGVVVAQPLVEDVLDVGRRAGDAFDARGGAAVGRVRGLGDGDPLVALLLEELDQSQAVVAQQHGVGIEGEQVLRRRDVEVGGLIREPPRGGPCPRRCRPSSSGAPSTRCRR